MKLFTVKLMNGTITKVESDKEFGNTYISGRTGAITDSSRDLTASEWLQRVRANGNFQDINRVTYQAFEITNVSEL